MESYIDLSKGLHTDFEPLNQPSGTYRYMLNGIRQLSGAIENERGTQLINTFLQLGRRIVGSYALEGEIIICSTDNTISEIGVLDSNNNYTAIPITADLNFKLGSIVKIEGKKNFKGQRIVYLVEKNGPNPMRCINLDDQLLLASPTFLDDIKLQINPITPSISVDSVVDGGSLPTGVYQAACRLLTRSTNTGEFSIVSPLVPIIDEASSASNDFQDGAPPQSTSPKAINFTISNIDTSFAYIEVVIATYTGTANILSINSVAKLPIDNRTTITFTYSSIEQNKESIDLQAITVKPILYNSAESIVQKDGILTLGNLTANIDTYDFQSAASKINLRYFIEEVPFIPGYKDPILSATKVGYQRDETYSFAIVPQIDGQSDTTAYHIPSLSASSNADSITRLLGSTLSNEFYPINRGYPVGKVAHHRMPTIAQEPLVVTRGNVTYLRILGVEADFTDFLATIPDSTKSKITQLSIVREVRDESNKTIIAQGIANTHIKQNGVNYNFLSAFPEAIYNTTGFLSNSQAIGNEIGFMSPETTIYNNLPLGVVKLTTVAELSGTQTIVHDNRNHDTIANTQIFLDYTSVNTKSNISSVNIVTSSAQYITSSPADIAGPNVSNITITGTNDTVNNFKNNGYLFLKLQDNLPINQTSYMPNTGNGYINNQPEFFYYYRGHDKTDLIFMNGIEESNTSIPRVGTTKRNLYNIVRTLDKQYASVYDASYILCGGQPTSTTILQVFGGDTYINKFGVVNQMAFAGGDDEIQFKTLSYFFCESTINTAYRHYNAPIGTEGQINFVAGTTPYYPKLNVLYNNPTDTSLTPGILNLSWTLGHGRGYNKQYSFQNSLVKYYPKQLAEEKVTNYSNRVIYSIQEVEGEQADSFRIFLANNYHDIPKDKGEITELFVHNHRYYIHTSRALYLSSFNDRVSQTSNIGEVYLGNGGVFNRPSEPILTLNGGYAGTTSSCGINTPYGRFFVDTINSKVYLLTDRLEEISAKGMINYFNDKIQDIADTPSTSSGYITTYDAAEYRILFTKIGEWTISYSPELNSWSSFHSYIPYHYITIAQKIYSATSNELYENNVGDYGIYYANLPSPLQLDLVINDNPNITKTFDNLTFFTTSQNSSEIEQHYDTFNTLQCYNTTRNTGNCRLIVPRNYQEDFQSLGLFECFAKLKSNEFRVAIPNDLVIDVNQSIFTQSNLSISRSYRPAMSGKWLITSLVYNNLRNNRFVLHNIGRIFRHRIR